MNAFHLQDFQIVGGATWLGEDGFDIQAKGDPSATKEQALLMLQSLLEERFKLQYHRETRELPVYALSVDRSGSKLAAPKEGGCVKPDPSAPPSAPGQIVPCGRVSLSMEPTGITAQGGDVPMSELIRILSMMLGRPVLDKTGMTTHFDVHLKFISDDTLVGLTRAWGSVQGHRETVEAAAAPGDPGAPPNILLALRQQLGLKLDSTKGPAEVMVIDRVEKPSAN